MGQDLYPESESSDLYAHKARVVPAIYSHVTSSERGLRFGCDVVVLTSAAFANGGGRGMQIAGSGGIAAAGAR